MFLRGRKHAEKNAISWHSVAINSARGDEKNLVLIIWTKTAEVDMISD